MKTFIAVLGGIALAVAVTSARTDDGMPGSGQYQVPESLEKVQKPDAENSGSAGGGYGSEKKPTYNGGPAQDPYAPDTSVENDYHPVTPESERDNQKSDQTTPRYRYRY